jgi:hypothetical protein
VGITHAHNLDRSEDGLEGAGAEPAMRVPHFVVPLPDTQSGTHVSVTSTLQVRLQQQALHLAAFGLLLALDLVQGELQRGRGRQPSLQRRELLPGVRPGITRAGD